MRRLSRAGFGREYVSRVILPEWWEEECSGRTDLLPELEIRVSRFLGAPISLVSDPNAMLEVPSYKGAQLRRVLNIDRDRLAPAIHAAIKLAGAVIRCLRQPAKVVIPPASGLEWRQQLRRQHERVSLGDLLEDLWSRGIPVIPADLLPTPSFQGLAAIVESRPVIVLGHKHDEPGRAAFRICHEAGHIAKGDCTSESPVVDEDEEIASDNPMEKRADQYAVRMLVGSDELPMAAPLSGADFKELAKGAVALEKNTGVDAGVVLFSWAGATGDYATATMATKSLYRAVGARRVLREFLHRFIDIAGASESDQELLRATLPEFDGADAPVG